MKRKLKWGLRRLFAASQTRQQAYSAYRVAWREQVLSPWLEDRQLHGVRGEAPAESELSDG